MFYNRYLKIVLIIVAYLNLHCSTSLATEVPIYDFSIKSYSQNISDYLPADSEDHTKSLLSAEYQNAHLQHLYKHYYATDEQGVSPWAERNVQANLLAVKKIELEILQEFDNQNKEPLHRHYAENFKEHDAVWLQNIQQKMDLTKLDTLEFTAKNRAITINNTHGRALPEQAPDFFHFTLAGQGFPFDNLQESAIWAGTPLYVVTVTQDKSWSLVLTPDAYFAWIKSEDLAYASESFITQWQTAAKKGMVAITKTGANVLDKHQNFQFTGYIGAIFPLNKHNEFKTSILIAQKNAQQQAVIAEGIIAKDSASIMPMTASKKNLAKILHQLQNRPYGWGGAFFYNDCSAEMKSIFTPFGIWLPRNSAEQSKLSSSVDLSKLDLDGRIKALKEQGHPLMTIIYTGGHVLLYVGTYKNANQEQDAITYQNLWGMSPHNKDKRYVVGQSLFIPLLKYFPENPEIESQANRDYFKLTFVDGLDTATKIP